MMVLRLSPALLAALALVGCQSPSPLDSPTGQASPAGAGQAAPATDLAKLSDEFDSAASLTSWKHVHKTEGWNADQLARFAVNGGWLSMAPHTSTWYMDYRGVLVYKDVTGDFVVTTKLRATGRDGQSPPRSMFSLGGLMIRTPRPEGAQNWRLGGENYVFLSLGAADRPGTFQFEVKTTTRSQSDLEKIPAASSDAFLQIAKIGPNLILLRKQGTSWVVQKRYSRPDMPGTLQVGLTVYTDYPSASQVGAREHNGMVIRGGNPDLLAQFDYVRFRRPQVPASVNIAGASDAELLRFLGDAAG